MASNRVVVKVGGSLFDHPHLGAGLAQFLGTFPPNEAITLVPGGGAATDVIRDLEAVHHLSDTDSHWLAIEMLAVMERFLTAILRPHFDLARLRRIPLVETLQTLPLPASWEATSDSIAAAVAATLGARLVLLKSIDIPVGTPWEEAVSRVWVDAYFPTAVADLAESVEVVNFRDWLETHFPTAGGE